MWVSLIWFLEAVLESKKNSTKSQFLMFTIWIKYACNNTLVVSGDICLEWKIANNLKKKNKKMTSLRIFYISLV